MDGRARSAPPHQPGRAGVADAYAVPLAQVRRAVEVRVDTVVSRGFGVLAVNGRTGRLEPTWLVHRNDRLPLRTARSFGTVRSDHPYADNHLALMSNLLAQSEALANGQASDDPHRSYAGGRPSTMILLDALTPQSLGGLIAMYEHSVYAQSVLWGINAFDQFGVELGKQLANGLLPALRGQTEAKDPVTRALLPRSPRAGELPPTNTAFL